MAAGIPVKSPFRKNAVSVDKGLNRPPTFLECFASALLGAAIAESS